MWKIRASSRLFKCLAMINSEDQCCDETSSISKWNFTFFTTRNSSSHRWTWFRNLDGALLFVSFKKLWIFRMRRSRLRLVRGFWNVRHDKLDCRAAAMLPRKHLSTTKLMKNEQISDDENFPDFSFSSIAHENILFSHNNGKQQREEDVDDADAGDRETTRKWEEKTRKKFLFREWKFMKNTSRRAFFARSPDLRVKSKNFVIALGGILFMLRGRRLTWSVYLCFFIIAMIVCTPKFSTMWLNWERKKLISSMCSQIIPSTPRDTFAEKVKSEIF